MSFLALLLSAACILWTADGSPCPLDWRFTGGNCYFVNSSSVLSWAGADAVCREHQGVLVNITDRYKQVDLKEILLGHSSKQWWINNRQTAYSSDIWNVQGAVDYFGEDKVVQRVDSLSMCVYMSSYDGLWYWSSCETTKNFVCEKASNRVDIQSITADRQIPDSAWMEANAAIAYREMYEHRFDDDEEKGVFSASKATITPLPPVTTPMTPSTGSSGGPNIGPNTPTNLCQGDKWLMLSSKCYQLFLNAKNWTAAESYCQYQDGHLATFPDRNAQTDWIKQYNFHSGSVWIGLQQDSAQTWSWTTAAPLAYSAWGNQTSNPNGQNQCGALVLHTDLWMPNACTAYKPFVCERNLNATTQTTDPTPTVAPSQCGAGDWLEYGGSCYLPKITGKPLSWRSAQQVCRNYSSNLAKIDSHEANAFLLGKINPSTLPVWLGMNRLRVSRGFFWLDGSQPTFSNWEVHGQAEEMTSCVRMNAESGLWKTTNCNSPQYFICQRPLGGLAPPPATSLPFTRSRCPTGWELFGPGKCTRVFPKKKSWRQARADCRSFGPGGDLLSIENAVQQAYLLAITRKVSLPLWIGMTSVTSDSRFLTWSDESAFNYTNWYPGQPSANCDSCPRTCGVVTVGNSLPGLWKDVDCTVKYGYLCQQLSTPDNSMTPQFNLCPAPHSDFVAVDDSCFKVVADSDSWSDALSYCRAHDSSLAYVKDSFDNAALLKLLHGRSNENFWLGLSDTSVYGELQWSAPWPPKFNFIDRLQNYKLRPTTSRSTCAAINPNTGNWNLASCNSLQPFVCMHSSNRTRESASSLCPSADWRSSASRCYIMRGGSTYTVRRWDEAKRACESEGYQLAVVTSNDDQQAVRDAVSPLSTEPNAWIGLNRSGAGAFRWVDGSALDHTAWAQGSPDNSAGNCVATDSSGGRWKTLACSMYRPYVCMIHRTPSPAPNKQTGPSGDGTVAGWSVFGIICLAVGLIAAVVCIANLVARHYYVSWFGCLDTISGGFFRSPGVTRPKNHHSVENLAYNHREDSLTGSNEEASMRNNGDLDRGEPSQWGSQQELVIRE